jgi:hypothetical protein
MNITKQGDKPETFGAWLWQVVNTCGRCGCVWNLTYEDRSKEAGLWASLFNLAPGTWRIRRYPEGSGTPGTFLEQHCPNCGKFVATEVEIPE